jgi:hypothetical protein
MCGRARYVMVGIQQWGPKKEGKKERRGRKKHAPRYTSRPFQYRGFAMRLLLHQRGRGVVEREGDVACGAVMARAYGGRGRAGGRREVCEVKLRY